MNNQSIVWGHYIVIIIVFKKTPNVGPCSGSEEGVFAKTKS